MVHSRSTLATSPRSGLGVKALTGTVLLRLLWRHLARNHAHLVAIARWLGRVRRGCALLVHAVVYGWGLGVSRCMVLVVHLLHRICVLSLGGLGGSLLASCLGLLLLLYTGGDGLID